MKPRALLIDCAIIFAGHFHFNLMANWMVFNVGQDKIWKGVDFAAHSSFMND